MTILHEIIFFRGKLRFPLILCTISFIGFFGINAGYCRENSPQISSVHGIAPVVIFNQHFYSGSFNSPMGIFCDPRTGEIYVADTGNNLIGIFNPRGFNIFSFGANENVKSPIKVMADATGRIYVLEIERKFVRVFNYRGDYLRNLDLPELKGGNIAAMATDFKGNFYFAREDTCEVLVYDVNFKLQERFGSRGDEDGQFSSISGIASDKDGKIYVTDRVGTPVQVFDRYGNYIRGWGSHDMGPENFSLPEAVAVDSKGRVIVIDALRQEIKFFSSEGKFLNRFGGLGADPGNLTFPADISIDSADQLYVIEKGGARGQVFREIKQ